MGLGGVGVDPCCCLPPGTSVYPLCNLGTSTAPLQYISTSACCTDTTDGTPGETFPPETIDSCTFLTVGVPIDSQCTELSDGLSACLDYQGGGLFSGLDGDGGFWRVLLADDTYPSCPGSILIVEATWTSSDGNSYIRWYLESGTGTVGTGTGTGTAGEGQDYYSVEGYGVDETCCPIFAVNKYCQPRNWTSSSRPDNLSVTFTTTELGLCGGVCQAAGSHSVPLAEGIPSESLCEDKFSAWNYNFNNDTGGAGTFTQISIAITRNGDCKGIRVVVTFAIIQRVLFVPPVVTVCCSCVGTIDVCASCDDEVTITDRCMVCDFGIDDCATQFTLVIPA